MLTARQDKARRVVTLRHWTTDSVLFVGGRQRPSPASSEGEAVDGCRMNLLATRLRLLKAKPTDETEIGSETLSRRRNA